MKAPGDSEMIEDWKKFKGSIEKLKSLFRTLNINENLKLNYNDEFITQLQNMASIMNGDNYDDLSDFVLGFVSFQIGEYSLLLLKIEDKFYNGFNLKEAPDFFLEVENDDGETFQVSPYVTLTEQELSTSLNFNVDAIKESFDSVNVFADKVVVESTNGFILHCFEAFFACGNEKLLDIIEHIYSKIIGTELEHANAILINRYQIKAWRGEKLRKDERRMLITKRNEANQDTYLLACANILLNNKEETEIAIDSMTSGEQSKFKELPIYKLYLKLFDE